MVNTKLLDEMSLSDLETLSGLVDENRIQEVLDRLHWSEKDVDEYKESVKRATFVNNILWAVLK